MSNRKAKPAQWVLYLDESGRFDDPDDAVAVAGVLIRSESSLVTDSHIRSALETAAPGLPWPHHTAWHRLSAWVGLCCHRFALLGNGTAIPPLVIAAAQQVLDYLAVAESTVMARVIAALDAGRNPEFEDLQLLSRRVQLRPELTASSTRLVDYGRLAGDAVRSLLEDLSCRLEGPDGAPGVLVLAASEAELGDAGLHASDPVLADRYLALVGTLCGRLAASLERLGGEHRVEIHASMRNVRDRRFGKNVPLSPGHVQKAALEARRQVTSVTLIAAGVAPFHDSHALFVVADHLANAARHATRDAYSPLRDVELSLQAGSSIQVRSGTPARSHLASSGPPELWLRQARPDAFATPAAPPCDATLRRWSCEQGWEWLGVSPA
jgi:hypothetical protein